MRAGGTRGRRPHGVNWVWIKTGWRKVAMFWDFGPAMVTGRRSPWRKSPLVTTLLTFCHQRTPVTARGGHHARFLQSHALAEWSCECWTR